MSDTVSVQVFWMSKDYIQDWLNAASKIEHPVARQNEINKAGELPIPSWVGMKGKSIKRFDAAQIDNNTLGLPLIFFVLNYICAATVEFRPNSAGW